MIIIVLVPTIFLFADIPDALIVISSNGTGNLSQPYSLTCVVSVNEDIVGLSTNLTLEKMTDNGYEVLEYSTSTSVTVDLSPLTTSDVGMYKCSFDTRQDAINFQRTSEKLINISVTSETIESNCCF